jgi:KUP system potassium uptake protein
LIVAVKYVLLVLRADNNGEGGILVLTALTTAQPSSRIGRGSSVGGLLILGLFGTALLFGDGMITPAISVLSAVEGVALIQPNLSVAEVGTRVEI